MSFIYVKDDKDISERVFIPLQNPSDKYFGVDISELDYEEQAVFQVSIEEVIAEYKDKIDKLMEQYDIKHSYRYFFPNKMKDLSVEA